MTLVNAMMDAILTTGNAHAPVVLAQAPLPQPKANEALIRVHAVSLNAGELRRSRTDAAGLPIGWDYAGTVERGASDGTGPADGSRVVGFVNRGAWAQFVAAPANQIGVLPSAISFEDASTLPVAGLTALRTLRRGGDIAGKAVLVVPGTGGVGLFALQLANRARARVSTVIRAVENETLVRKHGAASVIVGATADAAGEKYDLVLESLGGDSLGAVMAMLQPDGTVVSFGQSAGASTTFAANLFYATGGASLYGFFLFHEAEKEPVARDLEHLAGLVVAGQLVTSIDATLAFEEFTAAVSARNDRKLSGKVVVTFGQH